jgi:hypothetical protein
MTDAKADNKWRLLDELGRKLTKSLELVSHIKAYSAIGAIELRSSIETLVECKDLLNKLKSSMIHDKPEIKEVPIKL